MSPAARFAEGRPHRRPAGCRATVRHGGPRARSYNRLRGAPKPLVAWQPSSGDRAATAAGRWAPTGRGVAGRRLGGPADHRVLQHQGLPLPGLRPADPTRDPAHRGLAARADLVHRCGPGRAPTLAHGLLGRPRPPPGPLTPARVLDQAAASASRRLATCLARSTAFGTAPTVCATVAPSSRITSSSASRRGPRSPASRTRAST